MKFNLLSANQYCEAITDGTHDSPPYFNEGYPLVTSKCLKNGHIDLSIAPLISKQDYELINIRSMVKSNDILISMIGTVGEVALVGDELPFAIKNVGLFRSRNQIDAKYLSYYLLSAPATEYIRKSSTGSTQQYITLSKLKDFPILEPNNQEDKQHIVDTVC